MKEYISLIVVIVTLAGGILTWRLNEKSKRVYEEYQRKEEKYAALIKSVRGFYTTSFEKETREEFINQLNLCWMYCSDDVIQKGYKFLETVHTQFGKKYSDKDRENALGEFILAIRKDLIDREPLKVTHLKPEDFKHWKASD